MRYVIGLGVCWVCLAGLTHVEARNNAGTARYGIEADLETYPQGSAKEALGSVVKAIQQKRIDYLLAQLADPEFVAERLRNYYGGKFDDLVTETTNKLLDDPGTTKRLRHYLTDGEWEGDDNTASSRVKDDKRAVFFRKIEGRWFFENRDKAEPK